MIKVCIVTLVAVLCSSCYLTAQASEYLSHHSDAVEFDKVQPTKHVQELFDRVDRVRTFGLDILDLKKTKSYTKYVDVDRSYLVDVVSAVKTDSFERHTWWYPIFGDLPYRGYYRLKDAQAEAERLEENGYDVYVRQVDAFSSHGYFPELVYSFMASYTEFRIAELVLHELAHSKLWLDKNIQFNEEFASFVGMEGAKLYITETYGSDAQLLTDNEVFLRDFERFVEEILSLREQLEEVYESDLGTTAKRSEKERVIAAFKADFTRNYSETFETDRFSNLPSIQINNAFIDLYSIYFGNKDAFMRAHVRLGSKLVTTINAIAAFEELDGKDFDPYAALEALGTTEQSSE